MKLAAISLSFALPLVLTTYFWVKETNYKIDFAGAELDGVTYLRPVSQLLGHVVAHDLVVRAGDTAQAARLEAIIDNDLRDLLAVDSTLKDVLATTTGALSERGRGSSAPANLQTMWEGVKLAGGGSSSGELHAELITAIRGLITHVGDSSKLILDPDLDTYYVMDGLLLKQPELAQLRAGRRAGRRAGPTGRTERRSDRARGDRRAAPIPGEWPERRHEHRLRRDEELQPQRRAATRAQSARGSSARRDGEGRPGRAAGRRP
jgi:hypothetical protein